MKKVEKWTVEYLKSVEKKIIEYTDKTEIPILAEFAYKNNITREQLYQYPALTYALKRLIAKKEAQLERQGLAQNNTMAIFSLKQLGWRDYFKDEAHSLTDEEMKLLREKLSDETKEKL